MQTNHILVLGAGSHRALVVVFLSLSWDGVGMVLLLALHGWVIGHEWGLKWQLVVVNQVLVVLNQVLFVLNQVLAC